MQKLAEICVRRPVFATMLIVATVVIGGFSLFTLGLDRFPRIDFPVISVITVNPGAAPQEIETEITDRIEGAVSTVAGIDEMRSVSIEGVSQVFITFDLAKDADVAAQEVRDKVDPILRDLPETAERPIVQKLDPDAAPIVLYAVSAPRDTIALTTLVEDEIQERLESLNGVGEVVIFGGRRREIHVEANLDRLRAYNLTVNDLAAALRAQNLELPGGRIEEGAREVVVRTLGRIRQPEAFADLIVRTTPDGYPVRIRDVATVRDSGTEPRSAAMLDGTPAVVFAVRKQSGSNTVAVADAVRARVAEILPTLPKDVTVRLVRDQSEFIKASVAALEEHLILGGLFAAIVVFLFLWNFRSTIIAALAIPVSIIGAFALIAALGLHAQSDDDARADADGRHRHRRRDRRAGEHLPIHRREGHAPVPGGDRGHARDRPCRDGDDALAAGRVHAGRVHGRHRRPLHVVVRTDGLRRRCHQPAGCIHAHAHAGGALDQADHTRGV